jgi:probable phosphoglycerate mutase
MPIVACLRHGATDWNAEGRMQGRRDIPLSAAGRADVARWTLPADLAHDADWFASPLLRAVQTAKLMSGRTPRIEPSLIEMDWGAWEGQRLDDLQARLGDEFTGNAARGLDFRPPGGESPRDVVSRVARWLESIAARERPLVAVTHNGVLRALHVLATDWDMLGKPPVKLRPATLQRFHLAPGPSLAIEACNVPLDRIAAPEAGGR